MDGQQQPGKYVGIPGRVCQACGATLGGGFCFKTMRLGHLLVYFLLNDILEDGGSTGLQDTCLPAWIL